jgi:hypothetical protein
MKALVTFGAGSARELLEISEPTFREYADRHDYDLLVFDDIPKIRPASWFKVQAMLQAFRDYDEVLWLDADILILDGTRDLADEVPPDAWQAMVCHHTPDGEVPNHGVWFARRPMIGVLEQIWRMTGYLQHPWWEQAAGCELLGYDPWRRPMVRGGDTPLFERTHFLPLEWNSHRDDEAAHPRFWHASVRGDRAQLMKEKLSRAAA